MTGGDAGSGLEYRLVRELLLALECARSRLSVAIATENKMTPRERWRHYLDTEERMRRCVREIRCNAGIFQSGGGNWLEALNLLKQPVPSQELRRDGEAQFLCRRLYDVLAIIENPAGVPNGRS